MNFICNTVKAEYSPIAPTYSNWHKITALRGKNNHRHRPLNVIVKGNIESDTLAEAIKGVLMAGSVIN